MILKMQVCLYASSCLQDVMDAWKQHWEALALTSANRPFTSQSNSCVTMTDQDVRVPLR